MNKRLIIPLLFFLSFFITSAFASTTVLNTDIHDVMTNGTFYSYGGSITTLGLANGAANKSIFVMFDLSSLSGININAVDANLSMFFVGDYGFFPNSAIYLYNTTLGWNQTIFAAPTVSKLISTTYLNYSFGSPITYWVNFSVSSALLSALQQGTNLSLMLTMKNASITGGPVFWSKEGSSLKPKLIVNYNVSDCSADCGDCGCALDGSGGCFVPQIVGSYVDNTTPNTIRCVPYANCTGITTYTCPNGTAASQITPYFNSTTYPTTPGASNVCNGCWFINMLTGWPPHWQNVRTNCPADPECNCYGIFCSGNIYQATNISDTPYTISEWTAGCFNPTTGNWTPLINSTCSNTTLTKIVNDTCGNNCTLTNNTPGISECPVNTTTVCHDANCLPVVCSGTPPSTTCSSNSGGQLALALGSVMGITDCSLAQGLLAIVASIAVGFAMLYYTKDSEHGGQAFIFSTLIMLVMFTLISWFPAWLMVIMIVLGGYLVAKSMGFGGS